jgi:hypothetical protein
VQERERDGANRRDEQPGRETAGQLVSRRERERERVLGKMTPNADLCFQKKNKKNKNKKKEKEQKRKNMMW